jgi:hypothetical protein
VRYNLQPKRTTYSLYQQLYGTAKLIFGRTDTRPQPLRHRATKPSYSLRHTLKKVPPDLMLIAAALRIAASPVSTGYNHARTVNDTLSSLGFCSLFSRGN